MTVRIQPPLRNTLAACLCLAAVLLAAGCSAAPPGATYNSAAVGPIRHGKTVHFAVFPLPAVYTGLDNSVYQQVAKAKSGSDPGGFHFTVRPSMVFWLNCIGKGTAYVRSTDVDISWSVPCDDGGTPKSITFSPRAAAVGHLAFAVVTATRKSYWEFRIDEIAPKGVNVVPDKVPSRKTVTRSA